MRSFPDIMKKKVPDMCILLFLKDTLQACKYRAMILGLSRKTNDPWTKAEEKILKKYYPVEGSNVYKRLNNRTRNACISKAAQLHLQIWTSYV